MNKLSIIYKLYFIHFLLASAHCVPRLLCMCRKIRKKPFSVVVFLSKEKDIIRLFGQTEQNSETRYKRI